MENKFPNFYYVGFKGFQNPLFLLLIICYFYGDDELKLSGLQRNNNITRGLCFEL